MKTDSMILKAHQILGGPDTGVELGAVTLYLGSCGDYADREAIAKRLSGAPGGVAGRLFQVAIEDLNKEERIAIYKRLGEKDPESAVLTDHLKGLAEPIYVDEPPEVGVEDLIELVSSNYA